MTAADENWCDWCGKWRGTEHANGRRYDGRVFCSESCVRAYQRRPQRPRAPDGHPR